MGTASISRTLGLARSLVIYYGQPWRRSSLKRFYRELIEPGDLAFDIGAHVGNRSRTMLDLGACVVAAEPQPAFADFLDKTLSKRLKALERVAVGAASGEISLHISSRHPTVTTTSDQFISSVAQSAGFSDVHWDQEITVPMVSLDDLIARHGQPAFCKIDVEGAEAAILGGLSSPIKLIAFEYVPAAVTVARDCIDRLETLGDYRYNRVSGEKHRFIEDEWVSADDMRRFLAALPEDAPSGDIYAQRVT